MILESLDNWKINDIEKITKEGLFETNRFDFKIDLPIKNDISGKERLEKTICAFANTEGGFLIFGIKDNKKLASKERIVGINPKRDFPREVGDKTINIEPQIHYNFRNPPIEITDSKNVIHIIEIPKSSFRPHMTSKREFYYRTNRGNQLMSYQQIKFIFLDEEKRMEKLRILYNELLKNKAYAREIIVPIYEIKKSVPIGFIDSNILQILLLDGKHLIKNNELNKKLIIITEKIRVVEQEIKLIQTKALSGSAISKRYIKKINEALNAEVRDLIKLINDSLKILEEKYGFDESMSPFYKKVDK